MMPIVQASMQLLNRSLKFIGFWLMAANILQASTSSATSSIDVIASYREGDLIEQYAKDAQELSEVAASLGYNLPEKHLLTFVPAGELGQLSSLGRYALPHWYDGAKVFQSMGRTSGVMEFVTQGEPTAKSFYSDTTSYINQISIIMHVLGHNDFGLNSTFKSSARSYSMPASMELFLHVNELYRTYDHNEVSLFVQWLYSLDMLQDMLNGSQEDPEKFIAQAPTLNDLKANKAKALKAGNTQTKPLINRLSTPSVLAASVHHMHHTSPEWRQELLAKFEAMVRHYPGNMHTKIINEGWATFSQFLLLRHSSFKDKESDFIQLAELMGAVARPVLSNPYWLGLATWQRIYKRFKEQPQYAGLAPLELDRAFVTHAHELMKWQSNYEFLRRGLDAQWVYDEKLFLYRKATAEELWKKCGSNYKCYPQQGETAIIALSRNPERIINALTRANADYSLRFPQINLVDLNEGGTGGLALEHDHEANHGFSLNLPEAVQTLYVYALVMEKPISLQTIFYPASKPATHARNLPPPPLVPQPIKIKVNPAGGLSLEGDSSEALFTSLRKALDDYIADLEFSETESQTAFRQSKFPRPWQKTAFEHFFASLVQSSSTHNCANHGSVISHAPTTGAALLEYEQLASERFARMLTKAVQGQLPVNTGPKGVRFRVMPLIPHFQLDARVQKALLAALPLAPVDSPSSLPQKAYQFGQDDNATIGRHPHLLAGDIVKIPAQGQGQDGEGEEGEEGEEGDPQGGGQEPSDIEIPLAAWGEALKEELGLPHLRETNTGESDRLKRKKKGSVHRDYGDVLWSRTVPAALSYPLATELLNTGELSLDDLITKFQTGLVSLAPADYVVRSHQLLPKPREKAVIVVVMDFSGSMQGEPHKMAAQLVFNLKALMLASYRDIEFRYVVYDTQAREFQEEQIFGKQPQFLGGGTSNVVGYRKAQEILAEYPYEEWNKYVFGLGDAGANDGPETVDILKSMAPETQFMAFVHTANGSYADASFLAAMKDYAEQSQRKMGFAELFHASQASILEVLKTLFPAAKP